MINNQEILSPLKNCTICPRECHADRYSENLGYCKNDAGFNIASICNHMGEEPLISGKNGVVNVFFAHCNMQCIYCQNYQISNNQRGFINHQYGLDEIILHIKKLLETGASGLGFVSPSHMVPQMLLIIKALHSEGIYPTIIYNSNGYDKTETLRELEEIVDVYLPDIKYFNTGLGNRYSDVPDYFSSAKKTLKEMYRQKGSTLVMDKERNLAETGLIIRHLVLPNHAEDSISLLRFIAEELSERIHISLMSQYYPTINVNSHEELNRSLYSEEYQYVVDELDKLGFVNGWVQELESNQFYTPDFKKTHPFH